MAKQNSRLKVLKLMNFPENVFGNIVKEMEVFDVFSLSLISRTIRSKIKLVDVHVDCLEITHEGAHQKIIFRNHWQEPVLQFEFDNRRYLFNRRLMLDNYRLRIITPSLATNEYLCYSRHFEREIPRLLDYFSSVFRFRSGFVSVSLNDSTAKLRKLIDHPIFNDRLVLKLSGKLRSGYQNLEGLLHKYEHLEGLFISFKFNQSYFDHREILSLKRVCFKKALWMTREDLLSSEFQRLKLLSHSLDSDDLNAFIKHWLAGTNTRLCRLELVCEPGKTLSKEQVTKDLDCMLWEKKRRQAHYLIDYIRSPYLLDTHQGIDVLRKDGLLATILIKESSFLFCVWHTRFDPRGVQEYPNTPMELVNNL